MNLILSLAALQVGLPLLLILLQALLPSSGGLGLLLRAAGIGLLIAYAAIAGIWLFPPWWAPYALLVLLALATWFAWARLDAGRRWPWPLMLVEVAAAVAIGGYAIHLALPALNGRAAQPNAFDLAAPLGSGTYLVVSGGHELSINAHVATLAPEFGDYLGQSYALDIVKVDGLGLRAGGIAPENQRDYFIYGVDVLAPCTGEVVLAISDVPDTPIGVRDRANMLGNGVMLDCGGTHVLLGHLAPGSVSVAVGDSVVAGDVLGQAGNTGNTDEPHLHIHAQTPGSAGAPLNGQPIPITIEGRTLVRNDLVNW